MSSTVPFRLGITLLTYWPSLWATHLAMPIIEQNPLHEDPLGMRQRFEGGGKRNGNTREQQVLFKNTSRRFKACVLGYLQDGSQNAHINERTRHDIRNAAPQNARGTALIIPAFLNARAKSQNGNPQITNPKYSQLLLTPLH